MSRTLTALLAAVTLTACAPEPDDPSPQAPPAEGALPEPPQVAPAGCDGTVRGRLFVDADRSEAGPYTGGQTGADREARATVQALGTDRAVSASVGGGCYGMALPDGAWLIQVEGPSTRCTTGNCPRAFQAAVEAGRPPVVVVIGDSMARIAPGDGATFPALLAERFGPLTRLDVRNVAVSGSTTYEWLPDDGEFFGELAQHLPAADVVLITLGGNDVMGLLEDGEVSPEGFQAQLGEALDGVAGRMQRIVQAIRAQDPQVDLGWLIYPDYSRSAHPFWAAARAQYGAENLRALFRRLRAIAGEAGVEIIMDGFGATPAGVDPLLMDEVHLSQAGHAWYADELFKAMGGVVVAGGVVERDFGFAP